MNITPPTNILHTPLQIFLNYRLKDAAGPQDVSLLTLAPILPALGVTLPADLSTLLGMNFDDEFATLWAGLNGSVVSEIRQGILSAFSNAYGISTNLPAAGTLSAEILGISEEVAATLPPGTTGSELLLTYSLGQFSASFNTTTGGPWGSWADPAWSLTFDGTLELLIVVPEDPTIPMQCQADFHIFNIQGKAENFYADLSGLETELGNFFAEEPTNGPGEKIIGVYLPPIVALLAEMSSGFASAAALGFDQLTVFIDQRTAGNYVTLRLTHPIDPAPTIRSAIPTGVPIFALPTLATSAPAVVQGGELGVTGSSFPVPEANQLAVVWNDTTSGPVTSSEIQWGPAATPNNDQVLPRGAANQPPYLSESGLQPSSPYSFRVRDFDVLQLICTDWSDWLTLQTTATNQVQIMLTVGGSSSIVGTATIGTNGTFSTTITMPTFVPPGTYPLLAVTGGQTLATTTITVVQVGQQLPPVLQIWVPATGEVLNDPLIILGASPNLRGLNFYPSRGLSLTIDSIDGQVLGELTAGPDGSFTTTVTWSSPLIGQHNILAFQAGNFGQPILQVTVAIFVENPPQ